MSELIYREASRIYNTVDFEKLRNKSVLVTGATGLVGLFFIASLKNVRDDLNIKITAWVNRNIPDYLESIFEKCNIIKGDICNTYIDQRFDIIIHSAGYAQPSKFLDDKLTTLRINSSVTDKLFGFLNDGGSFLFVSSSELYSGLNTTDISEDMIGITNTDHPRSCYIEGKRCGEAICNAYNNHGYNVKIARLSLAYGPGAKIDDTRVVNEIIKRGLRDGFVELYDSGSAMRKYCYVTDAVEMMWNILLHGRDTVYNIGGHDYISIAELANKITSYMNIPLIFPEKDNSLIGNPTLVNISCKKYEDEFGTKQYVDLKAGLTCNIEWIKDITKV